MNISFLKSSYGASFHATKFCFLFGKNLSTSFSPQIHNTWFRKFSLNLQYLGCTLSNENSFYKMVDALLNVEEFHGANFTMPYKHLITDFLRDKVPLSSTVKEIGNTNTLFRQPDGSFTLENTDLFGIERSIFSLTGGLKLDHALILGGGGSAATTIYSLLKNNPLISVQCLTRNPLKTKKKFSVSTFLLEALKTKKLNIIPLESYETISLHQKQVIIINTLPLGQTSMYKEENTFCKKLLKQWSQPTTYFFDLIYEDTDSLATARELGMKSINGELMLLSQAAKSFELWTGINPLNQ